MSISRSKEKNWLFHNFITKQIQTISKTQKMEIQPSYFTNIHYNGEIVEEEITCEKQDGYYCGEEPVPEEEEKSTIINEEEDDDDRCVTGDEEYLSLTDALVPFINGVKRRLDSKDASLWFVFIAFLIYHLVIFYLFLFLVLLLIIGKKV